jgi:L-amino acid N-acyltransferase YncA
MKTEAMQNINYRNAKEVDLPNIVAIYNSTVASRMVTADTEEVSVASRQNWFVEHNANNRPLWIIESENNEAIGWVSFQSFYGRPAYDATAEISIYLDAEQRGKGLGKQVLAHCIEQASNLGIQTLLGYIFAHNEPSLKLFHQAGFAEWAHLPNIAVLDGIERSVKILGLRIR